MALVSDTSPAVPKEKTARSPFSEFWRRFVTRHAALASGFFLLLLLAMALGGNKSPRVLVAWCVSGAASLAAWKWLPPNMHVVVGAIAGGLVGLFWLEHKTAVADNQREVSDDH